MLKIHSNTKITSKYSNEANIRFPNLFIFLPQPKMYQKIAKHEQIMKKYADVLKSDNVVSEEDYAVSLQHFLRKVKNNRPITFKQLVRGRVHVSFTGVWTVQCSAQDI